MAERNPALELNINGETVVATPENTTLFEFIGELAVYDHVYIQLAQGEAGSTGAYLFKNQGIWCDLVDFMARNDFPQYLCIREVQPCDVDAFDRTMYPDIREMDSFPQEWAQS